MGLSLISRASPLAETSEQLRILGEANDIPPFEEKMRPARLDPLHATGITVFQINVGKLCNQTCHHCHVDAGPDRKEVMTRETAELCIRALAKTNIPNFDITGGAPELNPNFRWLVEQAAALGRHVIDRCNLSVLLVPAQSDLASFLAKSNVEVIASLPYFREAQTNAQRGDGVFAKSIAALRKLNELGYGRQGSGLVLNLVHNPVGAFLPPKQQAVEAQFRRELERHHGVVFNSLFTITNMPIGRFLEFLLASGNYEGYMQRLVNAFNPVAAAGVMCRYIISVGWDGTLYDCDFNQMLALPLGFNSPQHVRHFDAALLHERRITTRSHCYGCTAGTGSSCAGSIT